jgi:hypothetical protein
MEGSLDFLVRELRKVEEESLVNESDVQKVLDEQLRPQLTDLANWSVVDTRRIMCSPVLLDQFPTMPYQFMVYKAAASEMHAELSRHSRDWVGQMGYYVTHDSLLFFIEFYDIPHRSDAEGAESSEELEAPEGLTIQTIFEAVWKRQTVWHETGRLCNFLMDPGNWAVSGDAIYSLRFQWSEAIALTYAYSRTKEEIKETVAKQLETETFIIRFSDYERSCDAALCKRPEPRQRKRQKRK